MLGRDHRNNILGLNGRITLIGGERETPIDEDQSKIEQKTVYIWSEAYTLRQPTFFNVDFILIYRKNKPKYSSVWALQIKNLLMKAPKANYYYSRYYQEVRQSYGIGIFPFISYKIEF